jgi:hypothetical protein
MLHLYESTDAETAKLEQPPITEPEIIPCLFINGTDIEAADTVIKFTSWVLARGGGDDERRIVSRVAMSNAQARSLLAELRRALACGGH